MNRRPLSMLLLALVAAAWCTGVQAQWKWRDANGQMHISDRAPPPDVPEKNIIQRAGAHPLPAAPAGPASAASAPEKSKLDKELDARRKAADQERSAKAKADEEKAAADRAESCQRARSQLAAMETGQRMVRYNDKGEREVFDDKIRAEEIQRARSFIASECR